MSQHRSGAAPRAVRSSDHARARHRRRRHQDRLPSRRRARRDPLGSARARREPSRGRRARGRERAAHVIGDALGDRAIVPAAICLGIAGVDREDETRTVRAIMRRIGPASRVARRQRRADRAGGRRERRAGHRHHAGTGSIVYGRNASGLAARAGGWGHMIGDEGSGYWIGREALAAVVRAADGRGPADAAHRRCARAFRVADESRLPRSSTTAMCRG